MSQSSQGAAAQVFDEHISEWTQWRTAPWNHLRYRLVGRILAEAARRLGGRCRVLDAGGGDGGDSIPLALRGHDVTILDHSAALLERAADAAASAGLGSRVRTVCSDLSYLPEAAASNLSHGYDLVLCHNVLNHCGDVPGTVVRLVGALRPGGVLSLMAPNPAMDVLSMAVRQTCPARARAMLDEPTVRSETFGCDMRRLDPDSVEVVLGLAGCVVTDRFGIRCVTDLIADNNLKSDLSFAADLEELELALYDREPFLRTARFWLLLAQHDSDLESG
ncbi:MAG: methyltransferase domain-containing protein [Streptosporangiaceae bacterium]|nr:methyltransferase domain-containing protein [Streptosporangiaceae bacterium]